MGGRQQNGLCRDCVTGDYFLIPREVFREREAGDGSAKEHGCV